MVRGINGQNIFHDEEDYKRYLETLSRISDEGEAQVLGYYFRFLREEKLWFSERDLWRS